MAASLTLGSLLAAFLKHQGLPDCSIAFEPYHAKRPRRAKRSSALLRDAWDPKSIKPLPKARSVRQLLEALLTLSDEMKSWTTEEKNRYMPRLYDDMGDWVQPETRLDELRNRATTREQEGSVRVRRILTKALQACDRALESHQVDRIARELLAERREA